jgi:hypothetical protein
MLTLYGSRRLVVAAMGVALLAGGCGGEDEASEPVLARPRALEDPGPIHVHGLGVNPKDGALFIATHTGLFRVPEGEDRATRVAERFQDTMGFTVVGPDRFLGSGHPDLREELPPYLGLIESRDAGGEWRAVSRQGESDFHVLEAARRYVYGFGSNFRTRRPEFLVSADGGRSWRARDAPTSLVSLAIDPSDPRHVVASGPRRLFTSSDAGATWRETMGSPGQLAWPSSDALYVAGKDGRVLRSKDAGRSWANAGRIDSEPAAFEATSPTELYAARHDGTIVMSRDGGRSWTVRSRP